MATRKNTTRLVAVCTTITLGLVVAAVIRHNETVQVFDLPLKGGTFTPEWTDRSHVSILQTDIFNRPVSDPGSTNTGVTVKQVMRLQVREDGETPQCCVDRPECSGRWAAATVSEATDAVWLKEKNRWLPCSQYAERGPAINTSGRGAPVLDMPGRALGTLPDGSIAYSLSNQPGLRMDMINAWNPESRLVQHLGDVHFSEGMQVISARVSPDSAHICWLTYDSFASDNITGAPNWLTRSYRKLTGTPLQAIAVVAWLSNVNGSDLRRVCQMKEPGLLLLKYMEDLDEYIGPTGDEIAWSCDSQYVAFIRNNQPGTSKLYVCRAD